jgi:segregation and condensation protein B
MDMDQGHGQTPEAHADISPEPGSEVGSEREHEHATSSEPASALAETPTPLSRARKRTPVRVEAGASENGASTAPDAATVPDESPAPAAPREPLPSIADRVEAVILSTDRALSPERIAIALGLIPEDTTTTTTTTTTTNDAAPAKPSRSRKRPVSLVDEAIFRVDAAVVELNTIYESTGRSFRIEAIAGGYRVLTLSRYAPDVARLRNAKVSSKLSRAAIETLAIVAYKQPMTRAELEAIRGVSCGEVLKSLLERRLITIKGRAEELGRPMLYGTTREFLDHFGLPSIKDLPTVEELRATASA